MIRVLRNTMIYLLSFSIKPSNSPLEVFSTQRFCIPARTNESVDSLEWENVAWGDEDFCPEGTAVCGLRTEMECVEQYGGWLSFLFLFLTLRTSMAFIHSFKPFAG